MAKTQSHIRNLVAFASVLGFAIGVLTMVALYHITKPPAIELIEAHPYTSNYRYILRVDNRVQGECYTFNRLWIVKPE